MADADTPDLTKCQREAFLAHQITRLEEVAGASLEMRQPGAAVAARKQQGEFRRELDQLRALKRAKKTPPKSTKEHQAELLREARSLRQAAAVGESFTSASQSMRVEIELLAGIIAREETEAKERLDHLTEADIVAMLAQHIRQLPDELRERVRIAVFSSVH